MCSRHGVSLSFRCRCTYEIREEIFLFYTTIRGREKGPYSVYLSRVLGPFYLVGTLHTEQPVDLGMGRRTQSPSSNTWTLGMRPPGGDAPASRGNYGRDSAAVLSYGLVAVCNRVGSNRSVLWAGDEVVCM